MTIHLQNNQIFTRVLRRATAASSSPSPRSSNLVSWYHKLHGSKWVRSLSAQAPLRQNHGWAEDESDLAGLNVGSAFFDFSSQMEQQMLLQSPETALGCFHKSEFSVSSDDMKRIDAVKEQRGHDALKGPMADMFINTPETALGSTGLSEFIASDEAELRAIQRLVEVQENNKGSRLDDEIPMENRVACPESALGWTCSTEMLASNDQEIKAMERLVALANEDQQQPLAEDTVQMELRVACPESALGWTVSSELQASNEMEAIQRLEQVMESYEKLPALDESLIPHEIRLQSPETAMGWISTTEMTASEEKEIKLAREITMESQILSSIAEQEMPADLRSAAPESALGWTSTAEMLSAQDFMDLNKNRPKMVADQSLEETANEIVAQLPQSLQEALEDPQRAIVVTERKAPFRVVGVNEVWEGLCGYTQAEAQEEPIGNLLQGPETSRQVAANLIEELMDRNQGNHVVQARLLNYTKDGRKFHNRVQIGSFHDESTDASYFVAVLEEMNAKKMAA